MRTLLIATHNSGKLKEFQQFLSSHAVHLVGLDALAEIEVCRETGSTFRENARQKAEYYSQFTSHLTAADDSGLVIDALDGRPGVFSARFLGSFASDEDRCREVLRLISNVPDEHRVARFVCCLALARRGKLLDVFEGTVDGVIIHELRGEFGFGYDSIFLIPEVGKTMAELEPEEKLRLSHRGVALNRLTGGLVHFLDVTRRNGQ